MEPFHPILEGRERMKALPDIIQPGLKVLFIGYNPGLRSAQLGHHYAGKNNRFWQLLNESGLLPEALSYEEDWKLLQYGYGSTNVVSRPTRTAAEITGEEFREGSMELARKLKLYQPRIACYCGIGVYKAFTGRTQVSTGLQKERKVPGVLDYVCSSPSGLNRISYGKQLECFQGLKALLDALEGR